MHIAVRHPVLPVAAVLVWACLSAGTARGQNNEDGLFVTVPSPLTSDGVERIKNQVLPRRNNETRPVRKVVFDFNPDGKDATTPNFGPCRDLAKFIRELQEVQTIAFLHAKVSGHTVLPALACKEIVMSKPAVIGPVMAENVAPLDKPDEEAYRFYFNRDPLFAVVRKMFDKDVDLAKGQLRAGGPGPVGSDWYIDRRNQNELKLVTGVQEVKFAPPGSYGAYNADQARTLSLSKATAETRRDVAELYGISPSSIRDDPLQGRTPDAYRFTLKGEVDAGLRESVGRIIKDIKRKKGNILILTLTCSGGDLEAARGLADDLRQAAQGDEAVLVIGYIPDQAPDTAAFIALGCSDIVMSKRKDATDPNRPEEAKEAEFGDFDGMLAGKDPADAEAKRRRLDAHRKSMKELAEAQGYPGILIDGLFDKDLEILWVAGKVDRTQRRLMTGDEFKADQANWDTIKTIKPKGQLLKLNATKAGELGVARFVTDNRDPKEVYALYGLDPARVKEATPGWIDRFAEFLRLPVVTVLLVVIGFTGLILELKVPGLTVPGIIAALCFILVFWAQSRFSGEMFVLALLLFILGLVLVGLEIFVLPGFGAPGVIGIMCMLAGLGLVTFDRVPQTTAEWGELGVKVSQYLFAMMGAMVLAFLIARFLPRVPYANRLLLVPPTDKPESEELVLPGAGEAASLLGAIGTTNTALRPAGVVRFADKFVDVVSDGGFVPAGTRVQVIAVEGTRIVVKEV